MKKMAVMWLLCLVFTLAFGATALAASPTELGHNGNGLTKSFESNDVDGDWVKSNDDTAVSNDVLTAESYESYLRNYNEQTAIDSGVAPEYAKDAVEDAHKQLEKFMNLSKDQKAEFIQLLVNPDKLQTELEKDSSIVQVSEPVTDDNNNNQILPMATTHKYTVSYTPQIKLLGVAVLKYRVYVKYKVTGSKVKKILDSDGYVVRNLNPMVKTGLGHKHPWITSTNKAAIKCRFYYKLGPLKGLSVKLGNIFVEAHGNNKGHRNYYRYWHD